MRKSRNPALLWSGGKDSMLLLSMIRQSSIPVTLIHFYERLRPEVEDVITAWGLEVLSWRPAAWYLVPFDQDIALVSEYSFGDACLPVFADIVDGEECDWERRSLDLTPSFDYPFDLTIWGYKRQDTLHPVMPRPFLRSFQFGPTRLVAPLYGETDEAVVQAVEALPCQPVRSDAIRMCDKCRKGLARWDRESALEMFRERFHYAKAA